MKTDGDLGDFDKGSMVPTSSRIFQDVISPFSRGAASMKGKRVAGCRADARKVPFAVVEGVAVPQAPGAPGFFPAPSSAAAISKGGERSAGSETSRVAVATASSAEQQPAADAATAPVAGRRRRSRRLSAWADIDPSTAPVTAPSTKDAMLLAGYLPPPALSAGPWMGSGQKISAAALRWVLPPGSCSDDNATVSKAGGEAPPLPSPPPTTPPPPPKEPDPPAAAAAKEKKKKKKAPPPPGDADPLKPTVAPAAPALPLRPPSKEQEEQQKQQPAPPPKPLLPTPPKEPKKGINEPAAEKTAVPPRVGGKIDARALNSRISCSNLQLQ